MTETSLNSRGSVPHSLSSTSSTSQTPAGGRPSDPAKSTSWPVGARSWTGEETAIAHWSASAMLDLPDPLGPTTTAMPWSKQSSTLPGNDLKPRIRSAFRYIGLAFVELFAGYDSRSASSACRAARCSDAFLLEPEPRPSSSPPTIATDVYARW